MVYGRSEDMLERRNLLAMGAAGGPLAANAAPEDFRRIGDVARDGAPAANGRLSARAAQPAGGEGAAPTPEQEYLPALTEEESLAISAAAESMDDPMPFVNRMYAAKVYAKEHGQSFEWGLANADALARMDLGKEPEWGQYGDLEAIGNAFIGRCLTRGIEEAQGKLMMMDAAGEDASALEADIERRLREVEAYADNKERGWLVNIAKLTAGMVPDMGVTTGATALLALGVSAMSGGAAVPALAGVLLSTGPTLLDTWAHTAGANYYDLTRNRGVDKRVALAMANLNGAVQGGIEAGLANLPGKIAGKVTGISASALADRVAISLVSGGRLNFLGLAGLWATRVVMDSMGEGLEEGLQYGTEKGTNALAFMLSGVSLTPEDRFSLREALGNSLDGFLGSLVFSALGNAGPVRATGSQVQGAIDAAKEPMPKDLYVGMVSGQLGAQGVDPGVASEFAGRAWDANNPLSPNAKPTGDEVVDRGPAEGQEGGKPPRPTVNMAADGSFATADLPMGRNPDTGAERREMAVLNPKEETLSDGESVVGARYGAIGYEVDGDGGITITDVDLGSFDDAQVRDAVVQLMKANPASKFSWDAGGDARMEAIRQGIVDANPKGDGTMQWFGGWGEDDVQKAKAFLRSSRNLSENMSPMQMNAMAAMVASVAEARGLSVEEFFGKTLSIADTDAEGVQGTLRELSNGTKRMILAGKGADVGTFVREFFAVVEATAGSGQRDALYGALRESWEDGSLKEYVRANSALFTRGDPGADIGGVVSAIDAAMAGYAKSGEVGQELRNLAVGGFEGFVAGGRFRSGRLSGLFSRMREWLGRIWRALKGDGQLSQEISDAYERMIGGIDESGNATDNVNSDIKRQEAADARRDAAERGFAEIQRASQGLSPDDVQRNHDGKADDGLRARLSHVLEEWLGAKLGRSIDKNGLLRYGKFSLYADVPADVFRDAFLIVHQYLPDGELVDVHDEAFYRKATCYLADNGMAGFAVTDDGDLVSVFNMDWRRGFLRDIAPIVRATALKLDCYSSNSPRSGSLPRAYEAAFGFKVASDMEYDMQHDRDGIAQKHGMPHVMFMVNVPSPVRQEFHAGEYKDAVDWQKTQLENGLGPLQRKGIKPLTVRQWAEDVKAAKTDIDESAVATQNLSEEVREGAAELMVRFAWGMGLPYKDFAAVAFKGYQRFVDDDSHSNMGAQHYRYKIRHGRTWERYSPIARWISFSATNMPLNSYKAKETPSHELWHLFNSVCMEAAPQRLRKFLQGLKDSWESGTLKDWITQNWVIAGFPYMEIGNYQTGHGPTQYDLDRIGQVLSNPEEFFKATPKGDKTKRGIELDEITARVFVGYLRNGQGLSWQMDGYLSAAKSFLAGATRLSPQSTTYLDDSVKAHAPGPGGRQAGEPRRGRHWREGGEAPLGVAHSPGGRGHGAVVD